MADDLLTPGGASPAESTTPAKPAPAAGAVIESALPILKLMEDIVQEFRPLTFEQIGDLLEANGRPTAKATLHRQIKTLEAAGWLFTGMTGKYRPSLKFSGFATAYQQFITARLEDTLAEAAAVRTSAQEIIDRASNL